MSNSSSKNPFREVFYNIVFFSVLFLIGLSLVLKSYFYSSVRVVICDVGQGDGIYIRTKEGIDIIVDAGKDASMFSCLGRYMPLYDKNIEYFFVSHRHNDHYGGYKDIIKRYSIDNIALSFFEKPEEIFTKNSDFLYFYKGDSLRLDDKTNIIFVYPTRELATSILRSTDPNSLSQVFIFSYKDTDILFTGDATPEVFSKLERDKNNYIHSFLKSRTIDMIKLPHHGSANGITFDFFSKINPVVSFISVGENNRYGHPSPELIEYLDTHQKKCFTTSDGGDIIIDLFDKGWNIKQRYKKDNSSYKSSSSRSFLTIKKPTIVQITKAKASLKGKA